MNIVISGTSSGIGHALAQHLISAGHDVWGLARRSQKTGEQFRASRCDVSDWRSVERTAREIGAAWLYLDALVCCAGMQGVIGPAMTVPPADWAGTVHTNLDGTYFTVRAFFEMLRRAPRRGRVICFSGGGASAPRENFSAYGVAKTGIVRLVETLAVEWRALPVDINAVAPGAINTSMTEQVVHAGAGAAGKKEFAAAKKQLETGGQSLDKVIGLVEFLLSPAADGLSGKLISAQWDDWARFADQREALMKSDVYTLRRITAEHQR